MGLAFCSEERSSEDVRAKKNFKMLPTVYPHPVLSSDHSSSSLLEKNEDLQLASPSKGLASVTHSALFNKSSFLPWPSEVFTILDVELGTPHVIQFVHSSDAALSRKIEALLLLQVSGVATWLNVLATCHG